MTSEEEKKKLERGWIKSWMMIEALAVDENVASDALKKLIEDMKSEKGVVIGKLDFKKTEKVTKPMEGIAEAYSGIVEAELWTQNYSTLVNVVISYGPSAVEILEPKKLSMDVGEAQSILTTVASMIHRFASVGVGGVVMATPRKKTEE